MANNAYPKQAMESLLGDVRSLSDGLRDTMAALEVRIAESMTDASDEEVAYTELWLRQCRERLEELDKKVGHIRQLNWKRGLYRWYQRETMFKAFGHKFRLDFNFKISLPKERTAARAKLIDWLKAGNRMDALVMDEGTGEWTFDYKVMEKLVNQMLSEGNRPPDECEIKLHPQPRIVVIVDKAATEQ